MPTSDSLFRDSFSEHPSAPPELLPNLIGAVSSSIRFTSFIRDIELRGLMLDIDADCIVNLPIGALAKEQSSLAEIFTGLKCPIIYLGFLIGHQQNWENRGTHMGEVVHTIALGPGESRNIAFVNWRRRQLTGLEQNSTADEQLTAIFVQNRALEEIATAVATEHQEGKTQTEAGTAVTAGSFVAAGAVVGGIAGGAVGTLVEPGGGTIIGALVGGAAGTVAGGAIYSGAKTLGMIEAETDGDRDIVADVHQRIALSTSQTASAVRSLWSTAVVEDTQAESVSATTSNITNYNHMHSLNIEYFEVLQHYRTELNAERLQPLIYLPFTFLDFKNFRFVRDYWDVIRPHIHDDMLREQGESYFVTEKVPDTPDLLPVPPAPREPTELGSFTINDLVIDVLFDAAPINLNVDLGLKLIRNGQEIIGKEKTGGVQSNVLDGFDVGNRYTFGNVEDAEAITGVILTRNTTWSEKTTYRIRVASGRLRIGGRQVRNLSGVIIHSQGQLLENAPRNTTVPWSPAEGAATEDATARDEYEKALRERGRILRENERRRAAHDALVENLARFRERLQRLILRRRHFFTRIILDAIEPEEISQLLESVVLRQTGSAAGQIRLSDVAHTIPLGLTAGAFVLKLKRLDAQTVDQLLNIAGNELAPTKLATLAGYADETLVSFADRREGLTRVDNVYVPTGGLFAEAILGRSNSAEYLDMHRFFNWQDSPIPHQPPAIDAVNTSSRFQDGEVSVTVPESTLQVINPVSFPDPSGLQGVLAAVQNGGMFRNMSGSAELAGVLNNLSTLAGQIGQAASGMTGQAAQDALRAAGEVGQAAASLAETIATMPVNYGPPSTVTNDGAALNVSRELDALDAQAVANLPSPDQTPIPVEPSTTTQDIPRNVAGLAPSRPRRRTRRPNPSLTVSVIVRSMYGTPLFDKALTDVKKILTMFHEHEVSLKYDFSVDTQLSPPFYVIPLQWPRFTAKLTVGLEVGGFFFLDSIQLPEMPDDTIAMDIDVQFKGTPVTVTRGEHESMSEAIATTYQGKLGAEFDVKAIQVVVEGGGGRTGTDTSSTGSSSSESETILIPAVDGSLNLNVTYRSR